jgi:hypothetical protein
MVELDARIRTVYIANHARSSCASRFHRACLTDLDSAAGFGSPREDSGAGCRYAR